MSLDGPAVPTAGELVPAAPRTLFATDDPVEVLDHARRLADALKTALDAGGMVQRIRGRNRQVKEYVKIDGWQTLGAMLGVSPYIVWSRRLEVVDAAEHDGWEARAEARTVDGRVVGSAEAMVDRNEPNWTDADDYAVRSMAQTRAMSKALRAALGYVVALAGHSSTPAEEMDVDAVEPAELPEWAAPIARDDRRDAYDALRQSLEMGGADMAAAPRYAGQILDRTAADCGGEIPACIGPLLARIQWAITPPDTPDTPEGTDPE